MYIVVCRAARVPTIGCRSLLLKTECWKTGCLLNHRACLRMDTVLNSAAAAHYDPYDASTLRLRALRIWRTVLSVRVHSDNATQMPTLVKWLLTRYYFISVLGQDRESSCTFCSFWCHWYNILYASHNNNILVFHVGYWFGNFGILVDTLIFWPLTIHGSAQNCFKP